MSRLLVDLGSTRCKLAVGEQGAISQVFSAGYDEHTAIADYLARHAADRPTLLASVAKPAVTASFVARIAAASSLPVREVRSTDAVPLVVSGYRKPDQLGVDRLLAMVAARAYVRGPLCVVDAGTAITIDLIDAAGHHLGGFILPGEALARDCLLANTAIPCDPETEPGAIIGRDTPTAVVLGTRYAVTGLVEYLVEGRGRPQSDQPIRVVVGGGDAGTFAALLPAGCITLDHLVLRGLAFLDAGGSR